MAKKSFSGGLSSLLGYQSSSKLQNQEKQQKKKN
jgi:hypothetical protein